MFRLVVTWAHIHEHLFRKIDTLANGPIHRQRHIVLFKATIFTRKVDVLIFCPLAGQESLKMLVIPFYIDKLAPHHIHTRGIRAGSRIEPDKAKVVGLVGNTECACVKGWLLKLCLLYDRLTEYVIRAPSLSTCHPTATTHGRHLICITAAHISR